jgi:hypothetical protein
VLTIGQVLEVTIGLLRRRWRTGLSLALLFVAPGAIVSSFYGMRANETADGVMPELESRVLDGGALMTAEQAERLLGAAVAYLGASIVAGLLASVGAVAFSALVAAELSGGPGSVASVSRAALRRALSVVAFAVVTSAIVIGLVVAALGVVLLVLALSPGDSATRGGPGIFAALVVGVALVMAVVYLSLRWASAFAIMALEDAGWRAALARSWQISRDHVLRILAVVALGTLLSLLISVFVAQLLAIVVVDWAVPTLGLDPTVAGVLVVAAGAVVVAPLLPVLVAVLTVDLRRRHGEPTSGPVVPATGRPDTPDGS